MQSDGLGSVVNDILDAIAQAVSEEDKVQVYTSGTTNMLKYPELGDNHHVSRLLYALEEKKEITELMRQESEDSSEIQVYIGKENTVESMKDCSVVTATYELTDGVYGKIGIVGPKRMDYEKVVAGKAQAKRLEEDAGSHRNCRHVYSLLAGVAALTQPVSYLTQQL